MEKDTASSLMEAKTGYDSSDSDQPNQIQLFMLTPQSFGKVLLILKTLVCSKELKRRKLSLLL